MPGGGNSHQRKVVKKREETLTATVAEQVLQKLERGAAAAPTLPYEHPRSSLRDKLWNLLGSPIIWGAITLLLAAIGSRISSPTLFGLAFLLGVAAILKEDFFEGKRAITQYLGSSILCLLLGIGLFLAWHWRSGPQEVLSPKEFANAVVQLLPPWLKSPQPQAEAIPLPPKHTHVRFVPAAGNSNPQLKGGEEPRIPLLFTNVGDFPLREPRVAGLLKVLLLPEMSKGYAKYGGMLHFKDPGGVLLPHTSDGAYQDIIGERLTAEEAGALNGGTSAFCGIGAVRWKDDTGRYETRFFECLFRDPHDGIFAWHSMVENNSELKV